MGIEHVFYHAVLDRRPRPLGPVLEDLGEPAPERARGLAVAAVGDEVEEGPVGGGRHRGDGLPGRPSGDHRERLADPDAHRAPEAEPAHAEDRDRDDGHAGAHGEVGGSVVERQDHPLAGVDPPLRGDGEAAAAREEGIDPAGHLHEPALVRPERDRPPRQGDEAVLLPDPHVGLLRAEEEEVGPRGQRRDEHERVGPALVVEAEERGPVGEPLAALDPEPQVGADRDPGDDRREPVRGPVPRVRPPGPRSRAGPRLRARSRRPLPARQRAGRRGARGPRRRARRRPAPGADARVRNEDHPHPGGRPARTPFAGVLDDEAAAGATPRRRAASR